MLCEHIENIRPFINIVKDFVNGSLNFFGILG